MVLSPLAIPVGVGPKPPKPPRAACHCQVPVMMEMAGHHRLMLVSTSLRQLMWRSLCRRFLWSQKLCQVSCVLSHPMHARHDGGEAGEAERPAKLARELFSKAPRVAKVQAGEHNDIYFDPAFDEEEASFTREHWEECESPEPGDDAVPSATEVPNVLFYAVPADGAEPCLNSEDLGIVDGVGLEATAMGVLSAIGQDEVTANDRLLSTKHVRTWRLKATERGYMFSGAVGLRPESLPSWAQGKIICFHRPPQACSHACSLHCTCV